MPNHYARRVLMVLEALSQDPAPVPEYDVKKIAGMQNTFRIRTGTLAKLPELND